MIQVVLKDVKRVNYVDDFRSILHCYVKQVIDYLLPVIMVSMVLMPGVVI
jgi:hypothetical protein